jgi:nicotinic acid mononucleotide adenylyltransferase
MSEADTPSGSMPGVPWSSGSLLTGKMKIGIFGLSANPPTYLGGHAGIVRYLVKEDLFDEIWILPVYRHSYASKNALEQFEHRVQMCILNFECESTAACRVSVKTIERDVYQGLVREQEAAARAHPQGCAAAPAGIRMGSIDVIKWVRRRVPETCQLSLVLGSDTHRDLCEGKWKQSEE